MAITIANAKVYHPMKCPDCGNTHRLSFGEKWEALYVYEQWTENCGGQPGISDGKEVYEERRVDRHLYVGCPCGETWTIPNKSIEDLRRETMEVAPPSTQTTVSEEDSAAKLTAFAERMVPYGMTPGYVNAILAYNNMECHPPLDFLEAMRIANEALCGDKEEEKF